MGWADGRGEACTVFWWENLRERDHWVDPGVDGRVILTLCCSYLKPYCTGRKTVFFSAGILIYVLNQIFK
jgi:hypothetical protein